MIRWGRGASKYSIKGVFKFVRSITSSGGGEVFYPDVSLPLTQTILSLNVSANDLLMSVKSSTIEENLK